MSSTMRKILLLLICFVCLASPINHRAQTLDWNQSIAKARQLHDEGKFSAGIIEAKKALGLAEKSFGKNDVRVAETLELLALLSRLAEKNNLAIPYYIRAVEIRKNLNGNRKDLAETLFQLADTYNVLGKSNLALSSYQEGLALSEPLEKSESSYLIARLRDLARSYRDLKRYSEAERLYLRYLEIERSKETRSLYLSYEDVAQFYRERQNYPKAEEYYSLALSAMKARFPENDPNIALMMRRAAEVYTEEKKYDQAEKILDNALAILEKESPLSPVAFANIYADKARIYKRMNNREKAMEYLDKANSMLLKEKTVYIEPYRYETLKE
jgi:tetratricopeptide (TPR) repeat protein